MKPILLIGAGRMGGALLRGWTRAGIGPLIVVEPNLTEELRKLARSKDIVIKESMERVSARIRVCVLAVKPQVLKTEAARFRGIAQSGALMISIAAGTGTKFMRKAWGGDVRLVRAMPNIPGSIGHGISALYATPAATADDRKLAQRLLAALGQTLWLSRESLIDSVTAISGSGPGYVFLLAEALAAAGESEGLPPEAAERLARATISGAGALLQADRRPAAELRRDVTSPGGTTEAALKVLMAQNGLPSIIARAVGAARERAQELAS